MPILDIQSIGKSFYIHDVDRHITACRDVSIQVYPGEFIGITGKSGSGKSTILKLIYRSYLPESGTVLYDSDLYGPINLFTADERQIVALRRREIGYVSQFLHVIPRTTARTIVEKAVLEMGKSHAAAKAAAEHMLSHFELAPELWDSYPSAFSGGEKLRLNVARAMIKEPRLLLLDEPTASLDSHSKEKVRMLIQQLKDKGTTMLGIFHDLSFMSGLCDREYTMSSGEMEESSES